MKETILLIILFIIAVSCFIFLIWFGITRYEKIECLNWQLEAQAYPGYYFTDWQIEQCKHHELELKLKD